MKHGQQGDRKGRPYICMLKSVSLDVHLSGEKVFRLKGHLSPS